MLLVCARTHEEGVPEESKQCLRDMRTTSMVLNNLITSLGNPDHRMGSEVRNRKMWQMNH